MLGLRICGPWRPSGGWEVEGQLPNPLQPFEKPRPHPLESATLLDAPNLRRAPISQPWLQLPLLPSHCPHYPLLLKGNASYAPEVPQGKGNKV